MPAPRQSPCAARLLTCGHADATQHTDTCSHTHTHTRARAHIWPYFNRSFHWRWRKRMFWPKTLTHTAYGRLPAQGATPESGVRRHWRPGFHAKLLAPDEIPSAPGNRSMRSNLRLWQRFHALLQQRLERRGGWRKAVCYPGLSHQPFRPSPSIICLH